MDEDVVEERMKAWRDERKLDYLEFLYDSGPMKLGKLESEFDEISRRIVCGDLRRMLNEDKTIEKWGAGYEITEKGREIIEERKELYYMKAVKAALDKDAMPPCIRKIVDEFMKKGCEEKVMVTSYLLNRWWARFGGSREVSPEDFVTATLYAAGARAGKYVSEKPTVERLYWDDEYGRKQATLIVQIISRLQKKSGGREFYFAADCSDMKEYGLCVAECGVESPLQWTPKKEEADKKLENQEPERGIGLKTKCKTKALFYVTKAEDDIVKRINTLIVRRGFTKGGAFNLPDGRIEVVLEGKKEDIELVHKEVSENFEGVGVVEWHKNITVADINQFSHTPTFDKIYEGVDAYAELTKAIAELKATCDEIIQNSKKEFKQ